MRISEIFYSIQGEGPAMGRPATFVRFAGCNLNCIGCDTQLKSWSEISCKDILERIRDGRVIVTGGEPTMQMTELTELIDLLHANSIEIHIETNGTIPIAKKDISKLHYIIVSPKHGSQVDFDYWITKENVHFKFVLGKAEWCWPVEAIEKQINLMPRERVWIMPHGSDPDLSLAKDSWDLAIRLGINYSDRLHIRIRRK